MSRHGDSIPGNKSNHGGCTASVGFVSAGLLTMQQSIGVIIGANIGTTVTAQIIAFRVTEYAMLLVLIPLVSPLGWDYTFLMAILAVTLLVNYFYEFSLSARIVLAANFAAIALALYDTLGRQAYAVFMQWSVTTMNFVVVLGYLAYLRARRIC